VELSMLNDDDDDDDDDNDDTKIRSKAQIIRET
jgi:hypothetical protein